MLLSMVLAAALVGKVAGVLFGSMLGAAAFSNLHVTPDINADGERPPRFSLEDSMFRRESRQ